VIGRKSFIGFLSSNAQCGLVGRSISPRANRSTSINDFYAFDHRKRLDRIIDWRLIKEREQIVRRCLDEVARMIDPDGVPFKYCPLFLALAFASCASPKTVGFPGHQDRLQRGGDYDQREAIDDDTLQYRHGNFNPSFGPEDPDPDYLFF
jgi:hypothetical protein